MPRLVLARSERGEFGLDYLVSGRVTAVYCTDPLGLSATITLDGGQVVTGSMGGGQTLAVPGNRKLVANPEGGFDLPGVVSLSFQFGA